MASKLILILLGTTNVFVTTPNVTLVVPERNSSSTSTQTHIETRNETNTTEHSFSLLAKSKGYTYTPGIGAHKVLAKPMSWYKSKQRCEAEGGHLATINSVAEAEVIRKIATMHYSVINWIGFNDITKEGHFVTLDGQSIDDLYTRWSTGEPNNVERSENCVIILAIDGTLNDENCQKLYNSICELPYP